MLKRPKTFLRRITNSFEPLIFRSPRQALTAVLAGSVCVGGTFVLLPHIGSQEWIKSSFQAKRGGVAVNPTPKLQLLTEKAMQDLQFSNSEKVSVKLFSASSEKCEVLGSIKSYFGAMIGLPAFLNAEKVEDIDVEDLTNPMISRKDFGIVPQLKESAFLSDKAKLYVIAEGLARARNPIDHYYIIGLTAFLAYVAAYFQSSLIKKHFNLISNPLVIRFPIYLISFTMWNMLFIATAEYLFRFNDCKVLNLVGDLGEDYIDGGIEYHEKIMQCNLLINQLHPYTYRSNGNQIDMVVPFSERLYLLREKKQKVSGDE